MWVINTLAGNLVDHRDLITALFAPYSISQDITAMMNPSQTEYRSYLLRLWRSNARDPWHVMIEQVGSREQHTFANLESLLEFLQADQSESATQIRPTPLEGDLLDVESGSENTRR
jgi:hypothetical protein